LAIWRLVKISTQNVGKRKLNRHIRRHFNKEILGALSCFQNYNRN
jgi:hypothetical protein